MILSSLFIAGAISAPDQPRLQIQAHTSSGEHFSRPATQTYDDSGMSGVSGPADAANDTHSNNYNEMTILKGATSTEEGFDPPPHYVEYDRGQVLTDLRPDDYKKWSIV